MKWFRFGPNVREANADRKPLLLVGFPRGFTSQSYQIMAQVTGLQELFPSAGEFLNPQRLRRVFPILGETERLRFYDNSEEIYERVVAAMRRVRKGHIVKDVVQPFHVLRYLEEHPNQFRVLYVNRNLSHVAFSLVRREWSYVHRLGELHERFSQYPQLDVSRTLEDINYPVEVARSLGYAAKAYNYRDTEFVTRKEQFEADFKRDSASMDLPQEIARLSESSPRPKETAA